MKLTFVLIMAGLTTSVFALDPIEEMREGCHRKIKDRAVVAKALKWNSPIREPDHAEDLVDSPSTMIKDIKSMDAKGLLKGRSVKTPWSDSYWPISRGGISARYLDSEFMYLNWEDGKNYVLAHPAAGLISAGKFNELSPAEKYDALFAIEGETLTKNSWEEGRAYFEKYGNVENWMGHCHGWASASIMMDEPVKSVSVPQGKLYPSDIKAFATYLWAKGDFETRFIGERCNTRNPRLDPFGRARNNECLDNNPGTWHLVVVNQLGLSRRPFIMDASFDYEVWNQPVFGYEYVYFNPKTKKPVATLQEAIVSTSEWDDPRAKLRSQETKYIVGVNMKVAYAVENFPSQEENQEPVSSFKNYSYDLELDSNYAIVGGEWYSTQHPDFLWIPVEGTFPPTRGDDRGHEFDYASLSELDRKIAAKNAEDGYPWGAVVRDLFNKSRKQ